MRTNAKGIALVLTVGILVMLTVVSAAMVAFAGRLRIQEGLRLDRAQARLLARSGVDYASARLWQDPDPRPPILAAQPDDWTFRDPLGTSLELAPNPSYAQGEPYTDLADNGRHDLGYDPYRDLDFNGRFDSWSGRLRGARGGACQVFLLRVSSGDGAIPVNQDPADPTERLVDFLDTLGSACGASPGLGQRITGNRPEGGYTSLAHLHAVLGSDRERMAPLLRLDPLDAGDYFPKTLGNGDSWGILQVASKGPSVRRGHVDLNTARPELLQAMLEGIGPALLECPALTGAEAHALAQAIAARRPFDTWPHFAAWLYREGMLRVDNRPIVLSNASRYYATTPTLLNPGTINLNGTAYGRDINGGTYETPGLGPASAPALVPRWELLFPILDSNLNLDNMDTTSISAPYIGLEPWALEGSFGPRSWWNYDRAVPVRRRKEEWVSRKRPDAAPPAADTPYGTQEGSLETNLSGFLIESEGVVRAGGASARPAAVARAAGELRRQRRIRVSSQRDFENFIERVRLNGEVTVAGRPKRDRMQTYPLFSLDSSRDVLGTHWDTDVGAINTGATHYVDYGVDYPFASGSLRLMDRSPGPRPGDTMYVPCWEEGQPMRDPPESAGLSDNLGDFPPHEYRPYRPWTFFPGGLTKTYYDGDVWPHPLANGSSVEEGTIQLVTWLGGFDRWVTLGPGLTHFTTIWAGVLSLNGTNLLIVGNYIRFHLNNRYAVGSASYSVSPVTVGEWADSNENRLTGIRTVEPNDFHLLTFTFSSLGIQGYIDGLPDPGLHEATFLPMAAPPHGSHVFLGFAWMDEGRISRTAETPFGVLARSQESRFWTPDPSAADPRFRPVPSFLSPVYRFAGLRTLTGARWDGYVPARIRDAVSVAELLGDKLAAPLRAEVHCWRDPAAEGVPDRIVKLREDLWKEGGGWQPFEAADVRAFRYKVFMDASAIDTGYNNETPIFDSISVTYRGSGPRLSGMTVE